MQKLLCGFLFVLLLVVPPEAVAQFGTYTQEGFGVAAHGSIASNSSAVGSNVGYLLRPSFEVGGQLFRRTADDFDLTTDGVGPYLAFYPVREEEGYPFSFIMQGRYTYVQFSGGRADEFEKEGGSDTGNRYRLEIGVFPDLEVSESVHLLPYLGVSYALRTESEVIDAREELTGLNFRLSLEYQAGSAASVVLAPTAFVGDDDTTRFGVSAAFVF